jgi:hypothetical protein
MEVSGRGSVFMTYPSSSWQTFRGKDQVWRGGTACEELRTRHGDMELGWNSCSLLEGMPNELSKRTSSDKIPTRRPRCAQSRGQNSSYVLATARGCGGAVLAAPTGAVRRRLDPGTALAVLGRSDHRRAHRRSPLTHVLRLPPVTGS